MPTAAQITSFFDMLLRNLVTLSPYLLSLAGILAALYGTKVSKTVPLNSAHFSILIEAYSSYLTAISCFVYHHDDKSRDELTSCLYKVNLLGSTTVSKQAEKVFSLVISWSKTGVYNCFPYDSEVTTLQALMSADIECVKKQGTR